jgi:uncharacterized membrane protein
VTAINETDTENKMRFRWKYIILPGAFFLAALILAAVFYPLLPDQISYHFQNDSPDRWLSRGAFTGWMIVPQVFFALLSLAVVRLVMLTSRYFPAGHSPLNTLLPLMGNMMVLPQVVLVYAMLGFFLYNVYQINIMPLWIFTLIVLVAGGAILIMLFIRTMRRNRGRRAKISQE